MRLRDVFLKVGLVKIFESEQGSVKGIPNLILLVGSGLIGKPIDDLLHREGYRDTSVPFRWGQTCEGFQPVFTCLESSMHEWSILSENISSHIAIIWAAGICCFNSSDRETEIERNDFISFIECLVLFINKHPGCEVHFHFISSAGGLFEGGGFVDADATPSPVRPYGKLKLWQEQYLFSLSSFITHVYRPSSVYGKIKSSLRRNLIGVLIKGAILGEFCQISGSLHTLRDYIHAEDVAFLVVDGVLKDKSHHDNSIALLASFKPTSIFEVLSMVESITHHHIYFRLEPEPGNALDITFARPTNWYMGSARMPMTLDVGIKRVSDSWVSHL